MFLENTESLVCVEFFAISCKCSASVREFIFSRDGDDACQVLPTMTVGGFSLCYVNSASTKPRGIISNEL